MKVKSLLLLVCVALVAVLVSCKPVTYYLAMVYKAYGTVTEAGSGALLESVEVSIRSYQYSELTNGLGDYEIELAEGTWKLDFVKEGYLTETREVTVGPGNPREKVDVVLTPVGFTLSGAWPSPTGATIPDGVFGYIKLTASGGSPTDAALYWSQSTAFSGGSASYSVTGIAAGSYTAWAFIDANANAPNSDASFPDPGDWVLQAPKQVTIAGELTLNFDPGEWAPVALAASPYGTWSAPSVSFTLNENGTFQNSYIGQDGVSYWTAGTFSPVNLTPDTDITFSVASNSLGGPGNAYVPGVGTFFVMKYSNLTATTIDLYNKMGPDYYGPFTLTRQ